MSTSPSSYAQTISIISNQFVIYSSFIIIILGLIGNILNIITFTSLKIFRNNQCVFYILIESIIDCGTLLIEFSARIESGIYQYDLTQISHIWCKIRPMILQLCMMISLTTICFSSIDQYFSTSHHYTLRQISTLKLSQYLTLINIFCWLVHSIPFGIFYEIQPLIGCSIINKNFEFYFSYIYLLILNGIFPLIISSIFSILSYNNVRRIIRLQNPIIRRKLDKQLTAMVLIRVSFLFIVSIPFGLHLIYNLNRSTNTNDLIRIEIERLVINITSTLFYFNYAGSFYLYCLSSIRYRRQVYYLFTKKIWRIISNKICDGDNVHIQQNQIAPISQNSSFN